MLFCCLLTLLGLAVMTCAYFVGVHDCRANTQVNRLWFASAWGIGIGVFYLWISLPLTDAASQPLLEPRPSIDLVWMVSGTLVLGFGVAALMFSALLIRHLEQTPTHKE